MKLTPAEELAESNPAFCCESDCSPEERIRYVRQIQANAIRWAWDLCQKEIDENGLTDEGQQSALRAIRWCQASISHEANQLDTLPETKEQSPSKPPLIFRAPKGGCQGFEYPKK